MRAEAIVFLGSASAAARRWGVWAFRKTEE